MENVYSPSRRQRAIRALPFAAVVLVAFLLLPQNQRTSPEPGVVFAALLGVLIVSTVILCPWERIPRSLHNIPILLSLVVIALLYVAGGHANAGYGLLTLIPVVLMLLTGSRLELAAAIVGAVAVIALPHLAADLDYAQNEPRRIILFVSVIGLLGLIIRQLVSDLARRSKIAEERNEALAVAERRMAEQATNLAMVVEITREFSTLSDGQLLRDRICRAGADLGRADLALLLEPDDAGQLQASASTMSEPASAAELAPFDDHDAEVAFHRQRSHAIQDENGATVLYQPVVQDEVCVGVLTLVWTAETPALTERLTSLVELLAAEAAHSIERATLLARLADLARTDELTGLPNRRDWEGALAREMDRAQRSGAPLTVAMIDLDYFKRYNDRRGHQAGDRLLKLAASSWQQELRSTDVLARYGGEEFVLALGGCDLELAGELADRMRSAMPGDETCSIGLAQWNGSESSDSLVSRADRALYKAKTAGRDRVMAANWLPSLRNVS